MIGTTIPADAPLMESGLDSISATELLQQMSEQLDTELPQTLLFDHPTLESVADSLSLRPESAAPLLESSDPDSGLASKQLSRARAKSRGALLQELTGIASEVIGTTVAADAVLMEAGLDSISAVEL